MMRRGLNANKHHLKTFRECKIYKEGLRRFSRDEREDTLGLDEARSMKKQSTKEEAAQHW